MKEKLVPRGLLLQDFQMREVTLASSIRTAVNAKVTAQQTQEQQKFERATAEQQADIQRIRALATADAQTITTCGGRTLPSEPDARVEPEIVCGRARVGAAVAYVAGAWLHELRIRNDAEQVAEDLQHVEQRAGCAAGDVVHTARTALRGRSGRRDVGLDDVAD